jgi:hypothetical protein
MGNTNLIHLKKKRSWWNGRITAWCGATEEQGRYEETGWLTSGPRCEACKTAKKAG